MLWVVLVEVPSDEETFGEEVVEVPLEDDTTEEEVPEAPFDDDTIEVDPGLADDIVRDAVSRDVESVRESVCELFRDDVDCETAVDNTDEVFND